MAINGTFKLYTHLEEKLSSVNVNAIDQGVQLEKLSRIFKALDLDNKKYLSTVIGMLIIHHERTEEMMINQRSRNWRPLYGFEQRGNDFCYKDIILLPLKLRQMIYLFIDECIE